MNKRCVEEDYLKKKLDSAIKGIHIYKTIWRKYHTIRNAAKTFVLIFPEKDRELERYTAEKIQEYLRKRRYRSYITISISEVLPELMNMKNCAGNEVISSHEMGLLMESLNFYVFALNIIVVSLDFPKGRKASNIFSFKSITKEDIVKYGIFSYEKENFSVAPYMYIKSHILRSYVFAAKSLFLYLPPQNMVHLYYEMVLQKGKEVYKTLLQQYVDCFVFPAPYSGTGDVYLAATMLQKYIEKNEIDKIVIPVVGKSNLKIFSLFGFSAVSLTKPEMDNLVKFLSFVGIDFAESNILHHDPLNLSIGILDKMRNYKELDFFSMFQCGVFESEDRNIVSMPQCDKNSEQIDKIFSNNHLIKGRTVVLAPYNYTLPKMKKAFWNKTAKMLTQKGYTVCTNCSGKKEKPIKGTVPVFVPYCQMVPFLEQAGGIVAVRSGLCEVISSAKCKKVIFYLKGFNWNGKDNFDYFSLNKMGLCDDAVEYQYGNNTTQLNLLNSVADLFEDIVL